MKKSIKFRTFAGILAWIIAIGTIPPVVSGAEEIETEPTIEIEEIYEEAEPAEAEFFRDEPVETEPAETEPEVIEPEETEPAETEPEVIEPEETEPEVIEPAETEPEVIEPEETEPEIIEPAETEPEVVEPEETEPEVVEPAETEPEVIEPAETEPEIIEPNLPEPEEIPTVCELQEHIHSDECYSIFCELPEHIHTEECGIASEIPAEVPEEPVPEEEILPEEPVFEEIPEETEEPEEPAEIPEQTLEVYGLVKVSGRIPEGVELTAEMLDETEPEEPAEEPVWDIVDDESIEDIVIDEEILYDDEIIFFDDIIVEAPVYWNSGEEADEPAEETETEYAFAIDITLYDEFGEVWQPEEPVTVTLDAYALGLNDGDEIQILHEHDGWENDLGVYTVEEGELVFEVDGFSVMRGILMETVELTTVEQEAETYLAASNEIWNETNSENCTIGAKTIASGSDVTVTLNGNVTLTGTITIKKNASLTISGNNKSIFRSSTLYANMFIVEPGGKLIINDTTIDGKVTWTSNPVQNSTRRNYSVTQIGDTAVDITAAKKSADENCYKPVIYSQSDGSTGGTKIELNRVTMQHLLGNASGSATAIETETKKATDGSLLNGFPVEVVLSNVNIVECLSTSGHSVVLLNCATAQMNNCVFTNNEAYTTYAGVLKAGGSTEYCKLEMNNCTATGSYSSGWGGFILWAANAKSGTEESKAIINNCTFTNNTARYLGGAISNEAIMEISGCTISGNFAMAGGGIATFPFTLTSEEHIGSKDACGLTLGLNNTISNNQAFATGTFKPFSSQNVDGTADKYTEDATSSDDSIIDNIIEYPGGGGGIWCYMNKPSWTCSLEIGEGNTIANNTANNMGGGVYVHHDKGTVTTLTISGAEITNNSAVNGGGVAVNSADLTISAGSITNNEASENGGGAYVKDGTCKIIENIVDGTITAGSITNNTANGNGGAAYVEDGTCEITGGVINGNVATNGGGFYLKNATINVNGGSITGNSANGKPDSSVTTANTSANNIGVGGGVYVENGVFSMATTKPEGDDAKAAVGLYGNQADFAADDVYADKDSSITIPAVDEMNLIGENAEVIGHVTNWFEDYADNDTRYTEGFMIGNYSDGAEDIERYREAADEQKKAVTTTTATGKYVCLTLGFTLDHIILTIEKIVSGNMGDRSKVFDFEVKYYEDGSTQKTETVSIRHGESQSLKKVLKGKPITITELDTGSYEVSAEYWEENASETKYVGSDNVVSIVHDENVFTVDENIYVVYTNHYDADIDTAVTLDILPYIILFSIVGTGVILASADKRRRTDED